LRDLAATGMVRLTYPIPMNARTDARSSADMPPAVDRRPPWLGTLILAAIAVVILSPGCRRSRESIPESPPDAIQTVVDGLADHQPQVLWYALPPSYQADLRELIATFCDHMDADLYDRTFRLLAQSVRVMKEKREFIYHSPLALSTPLIESSMGSQWNETVRMLDAIAKSDLSSLELLRQLDPGEFLASTGHRVMLGLENLRMRSQRSPTPGGWERASEALKGARLVFLEATGQEGVLQFSSPTNALAKHEVKLTRVEGRWVPADMAANWRTRVEQAKSHLAKLKGAEFEKAKPVLSMVLSSLESTLESLLEAKSQKEFDEILRRLAAAGGMLRALKDSPP